MKKLKKRSKKEIIEYLSIDKLFNIYTRNYIEYIISEKDIRHIYLLDFINIHNLNKEIGFLNVNKKFRYLFNSKPKNTYIGRFFSGDEILICCEEKNDEYINILKNKSNEINMDFRFIYEYRIQNDIESFLNNLITNI